MKKENQDKRIKHAKILAVASSSIRDDSIQTLSKTLFNFITERERQMQRVKEKETSI